jgi:OOP family OmpA-OmpF porin
VRNYLIANFGIKAGRLEAKGYGETFPIADNASAEGRQRNRRVELSVYALNKK